MYAFTYRFVFSVYFVKEIIGKNQRKLLKWGTAEQTCLVAYMWAHLAVKAR